MLSENRSNAVIQYVKRPSSVAAFEAILGDRGAKEFVYSVLIAVQSNSKLMSCDPESVYTCALRAATLNVSVDPSVHEAYLVPYGNRCTMIPSAKGLYNLALRTDKYRYINVGKIYEGQEVIEDPVTGFHTIEGKRKKGGDIIGYIGAFEYFNGYRKTIYMSVEDIHAHAKRYNPNGYESKDGAWKNFTRQMEEKTILRQLLNKWGELRPGDKAVLEQIERDSETPEDNSQAIEADYFETIEEPEERTANEAMAQLGFARWTTHQTEMLINKKLIPDDDPKEAETILDKSILKGNEPDEDFVFWVTQYNANKQTGKKPAEAAKAANNAYQNFLRRQEK